VPQASPTGQQAYLTPAAKRYKMLELWSNKRKLMIGGE
jgi:hypothetical protein